MKKVLVLSSVVIVVLMGVSIANAQTPLSALDDDPKIIYFNPDIYPDIEEIKEPTNQAFFDAVSNQSGKFRKAKVLKAETPLSYEEVDTTTIVEYCKNNDADFAVVPKVKYFKVGIGKYVFSNQVIVSMKFFDSKGNLITETDYDTYRKNMRMLGSTTNSIKIGTAGAIKDLMKNIRKIKTADTL